MMYLVHPGDPHPLQIRRQQRVLPPTREPIDVQGPFHQLRSQTASSARAEGWSPSLAVRVVSRFSISFLFLPHHTLHTIYLSPSTLYPLSGTFSPPPVAHPPPRAATVVNGRSLAMERAASRPLGFSPAKLIAITCTEPWSTPPSPRVPPSSSKLVVSRTSLTRSGPAPSMA